MVTCFKGPKSIVDAYGEVFAGKADLVLVEGLVASEPAIAELQGATADYYGVVKDRGAVFELLNNEIPLLGEAAKLAEEHLADLPDDMMAVPGFGGYILRRIGNTFEHIDEENFLVPSEDFAMNPLIFGPLAVSIGLGGFGRFGGARFYRDMTDDELRTGSPELRHFQDTELAWSMVEQAAGDGVLIPGVRRPSVHRVEVSRGLQKNRASLCIGHAVRQQLQEDFDVEHLRRLGVADVSVPGQALHKEHQALYKVSK